jgi:glycosyltransferase involved in cell wall biosynthesis
VTTGSTEKPILAFLVNGDEAGAMGIRARSFAVRLEPDFQVHIVYRQANKVHAILQMLGLISRLRPDLCYVLDMGFSGVIAAALHRAVSRCRTIVDTGDSIYELSRSTGSRGRFGLLLTRLLEHFAFWTSDHVVVRSHPHQDLLRERGVAASVLPDGVDTREFFPSAQPELRHQYGLEGYTVIGLLGSLIWSPRLELCYGWELIELMDLLRDVKTKAVIIGDGSGLGWLKERCAQLGLSDRVVFLGRLAYHDLPRFLNIMDVCLSTQTNDAVGQVRTTGKLPLYLACGSYVLSTEVGEAARVLPAEMLIPYNGTKDLEYPRRLAVRVRALLANPERLDQRSTAVGIARANFEYDVLAAKMRPILAELLSGTRHPVQSEGNLSVLENEAKSE